MPVENSHFLALKVLQQDVHAANTLAKVGNLVFEFGRTYLAADSVKLLPVAVPASNTTAILPLPIPGTGYWLVVERPLPFSAEEIALTEIMAALLATGPFFQVAVGLSQPQWQLLQRLSQVVVNQRHFQVIMDVLEKSFPDVCPAAGGRLLLLDRKENRLLIQAFLGNTPASDLAPLAVAGDFQKALDEGATVVQSEEPLPQLLIPVRVGEATEALLELTYPAITAIPSGAIPFLELLAGYIGIALANTRLWEQAWQRANQLEVIYRVTESARVLKPLRPTLTEIHEKLMLAFKAPTCYIALYDPESQLLSFPAVVRYGERFTQEPISILDDRSLIAWVITNNQPYVADDWPLDDKPVEGIIREREPRSVICVPMRVANEVLGVISIQSDEPAAFDATDFQTLTAVASHVAVIIKNAHLYAMTQDLVHKGTQDYQVAVALRQAIAVISTSLEPEVVLDHLLLALDSVVTYDTAFAFVYEDNTLCFVTGRDSHDRPLNFSAEQMERHWRDNLLLQEVVATREALLLNDVRRDPRWVTCDGWENVRTWMGVPLIARGVVLGVLMINSYEEGAFGKRETWLTSTLATHASVALQNARLYNKTQQQLSELSTLYQASATMTANLDQDFVLQTVVSEMVRALHVDSCTIFVWDENHQSLNPVAHKNQAQAEQRAPGLGTIEHLEKYPIVRQVFQTQAIHSLRRDEATTEEQIALLDAIGFHSVLLVPLIQRSKVLGLLALAQMAQPRIFSQSELRLAQNLAGQAAVAIEHAHLFSQAQRRINEVATFHEIVLQLNTPLELSVVLDTIAESALKLIDASNLHIYLYDAATQKFTLSSALWRDGRRKPAVAAPRSDGITATVVRQGKPIIINDASSHSLYQSEQARAWGIYAIAGFPLKYGDEVLGAFTMTYVQPHTFTEEELLLLNLLADQAAVAVRNARLFDESQRRLRDTSALVDMAKQVTGKLKLQSVLQTTVQILKGLLNARASTITMLSEDGLELMVAAAAGVNPEFANARMKLGEGVSGEVVNQCELIYVHDAHRDPDFLFFDEVVRSLLAVPLIIRGEAIGTLTVDSDQPNAFSESDIQLMTIAAAQVSIAIANARLFEELERRAAELAVAYDELKESDRLKDELVQNVSHELRTPLTFVKGYVDLLMDGEMGLVTPDQQYALQIVSEKTDEITRIIDDIITLQRIDAGNLQLEKISMADLINTAVTGYRLVATEKGLTVTYTLPLVKGWVMIDKGRVNQVLANLIGNAMKFSPDGGTITVAMYEEKNEVCVVVTDQGIGVPTDKQERIFERFYQVDGSSRRRFGGTGIGLAIVKRIIDAHYGRIWVESEINKGSSFYFALPKAEPEIEMTPTAPHYKH
jgi:GAF domain-containing protein